MNTGTTASTSNNILMKQIDKINFNDAKQLVKDGLLEQGLWVYRFVVLKAIQIHASLLALALTVSWIFCLSLSYLCLIFLILEITLFLHVRSLFCGSSSFELLGLSSWEEFSLKRDKFDRFWVAIDGATGAVIGTIEAQVFGKFKTIKTDYHNDTNNNDTDEHYISIEIKRLNISSSFRRTGLAQKLLDEVLKYVEEQHEQKVYISKVVLFINAMQKALRKLYEKNGFEQTNQWQLPVFAGLTYTTLCLYERKIEFQ